MCMMRISHLFAVVPISLLLTLSFFVLLNLRKVEEKGLKIFGYVVVSFLWLAVLIVFSSVVYTIGRSSVLMERVYERKMKKECMAQMMQKNSMPGMGMSGMSMPEKKMSKFIGNKGIVSKGE